MDASSKATTAVRKIGAILAAAACGSVSVTGWAPYAWWWLALAGYSGLFWLVLNSRSAQRSFSLGFVFGLSMHLAGHGWIMSALRTKIGVAVVPAAFETLIFAAYLALFTAIPCLLWHTVKKPLKLNEQASVRRNSCTNNLPLTLYAIASFSSMMTLGEWMRSLFFNGFTSMSLGYSLIDTWLAGHAPVFGLYGVSWIGYCLASIAALCTFQRTNRYVFAMIALFAFGMGAGSQAVHWTHASGPRLSYRLIQSNVAQERKFDPLYVRQNIQQLIETIGREPADLVITAETAFPVFLNDLPVDALTRLQQFSARTNSHVFLGIATSSANGNSYNSVVQLEPTLGGMAQYNKVSLMPFGEYSPTGFSWFTRTLNIPLKDLSAGTAEQQPFSVGSQRIGTLICHDDLTGQEMRHWLPEATLIINPSNLAWFEGSTAIDQRLQIVRMRALEAGRPILRATNTGITAHIAPNGEVVNRLREKKEAILTGEVQPMQGKTPFALWGNWPVVLACCGLLLSIFKPGRLRWPSCRPLVLCLTHKE